MNPANIFKTRQTKLFTAIQESGFSALVLNPGPSMAYLTGLSFHVSERPVVVTFTPGYPLSVVLPELEIAKLDGLSYPIQAYPYGEDPETWIDAFNRSSKFHKFGSDKIGLEPRGLRFLELRLLQKASPNAIFSSAEDLINTLRMLKDDVEIGHMQKAVDIAQIALKATLPIIQIGVTEAEIAAELYMKLVQYGSSPMNPFSPIVSGGPNSANPHASPSKRCLAPGDLLVIDFGAYVNGYFSDITRTFAIGMVEPQYQAIAGIVHKANQAGRKSVKPGVTADSVDDAARGVIEKAGYGQYFFHRTGHGLGLEIHEAPYIRKGNHLLLEPGMTFTIEPGIYLPGRNGVRIEDNVVVTSNGVRSLTSLPRELMSLPI